MSRLFATAGLLTVTSAVLALWTGSRSFQALTVILSVGLIALYFYLRLSLPARSDTLQLPGLREPVEVYHDDRGVPHIYARNLHDLYMAQGYVTARDRLWAMDLSRRTASGEMAELFGQSLVELDKHFRTVGLRRAAAASLSAYSEEVRGCLEAYAAGVNARIAQGKLPPEFTLLGYRPQPWTPEDTLAVSKYMCYDLSGHCAGKLFRARLVQAVGAEQAAELFWQKPDLASLKALEELHLPDTDGLLNLAASTVNETAGGNCWVAAGSRTRSRAPLLANDLNVGLDRPTTWYQTHLIGPGGLDVTGVTVPGMPGIVLGHNRDIAWGMSSLNLDDQDLYLERPNPAAPDEFAFGSAWEKAAIIRELIPVRGGAEVVHDVWVTRHGPVLAQCDDAALALRWTALEASTEVEGYLAINRARSWAECRQALESFGAPAQHFLYAGRDGTIAWRQIGKVPVRAGGDGQAPAPGWDGEHEWMGFLPFGEMPEIVNPPEDFLCPEGTGCASYRSRRVTERLRGAADLTVEKMQEIQTERVNLQARSLLQLLLNAVQEGLRQGNQPGALTDLEKRALLMLSGWDCQEAPGAPEPAFWHQWYLFLQESIFRPQIGLDLFDQFVSCGTSVALTDRLLHQVAEGMDSAWLTREGEQGLARVALRSFRRAVALLAAKQGPQPERWRWGKEHRLRFEHPLTRVWPALKFVLNLGPFPVGGSGTTVSNCGFSQLRPFEVNVAATWRQVVDLGMVEESYDICAPGQSGHPLSPHWSDQLGPWLKGEYQTQLFRHDAIREMPRLLLQPK